MYSTCIRREASLFPIVQNRFLFTISRLTTADTYARKRIPIPGMPAWAIPGMPPIIPLEVGTGSLAVAVVVPAAGTGSGRIPGMLIPGILIPGMLIPGIPDIPLIPAIGGIVAFGRGSVGDGSWPFASEETPEAMPAPKEDIPEAAPVASEETPDERPEAALTNGDVRGAMAEDAAEDLDDDVLADAAAEDIPEEMALEREVTCGAPLVAHPFAPGRFTQRLDGAAT